MQNAPYQQEINECVQDAVNSFPINAPFYEFYFGHDLKWIENIEPNVNAILFSRHLVDQVYLLPSGGYTSPILMMDSLLHHMCPFIETIIPEERNMIFVSGHF